MGNSGPTADETEVPTLAAGTTLGKYSIVRLLGAGGMGAVYEATHSEIGKRVAIKILSPAIAAVPGARARFLREAQLTSRVRHPHIVDVTDMGSDAGQTYLVMEFLHGEDLAQRLERLGPIPCEEMVDIMLPVCSAVSAAHGAGITHRDLKPQNIFLATGTRRVHPKVLDFGISKGTDVIGSMSTGTLTATGSMIGTPYYLAPEQILDSKSAGSQSDQYALGVIFYECLTGKRPYDGDNLFVVFQGIVGGTPTMPRALRPDIPPELEDIVLRAMKSDAKARFATIEDFGRAMLPFASSRARVIWEEAFAVGGAETSVPPGRPSIAVMPTPSPPTRAATLMPPGLAKLPIPGQTPTPPPSTSAAGLKTPTPPPRTIAQWGMSPVPGARAPGTPSPATPSPATTQADLPPAYAVPAAAAPGGSSKSHPVYDQTGLDMDVAPPRKSMSMKGVLIAAVVGAAVVTGVMLFLRGGSDSASPAPAPAAAPAASAPAAAPTAPPAPAAAAAAPAPAVPAAAAEKAPGADKAPPPEAPPAAAAAKAPAVAAEASSSRGSSRSKSRSHGKSAASATAAAKPAAKPAAPAPAAKHAPPAAKGVPVID
jgi:serine/threonine protein kinase